MRSSDLALEATTQSPVTNGEVTNRRRWPGSLRVGDVVFAIAAMWTIWWYLQLSRDFFFAWDDWGVAQISENTSSLIEPKGGHLSLVPLLVYRGLYAFVGIEDYTPFRMLGLGSVAALAITLFVLYRRRIGSTVACLFASIVLWMPKTSLTPFLFNFHLALLGGVVCAAALPSRTKRADVIVGVALSFALATSAVGVPVAAACVVFSLLDGFRARRWLAVGLPTGAWIAWYTYYRDDTPGVSTSLSDKVSDVATGFVKSFATPLAENSVAGALLIVAAAGLLAWRCVNERRTAYAQVAWMAALVAWWAGLALSRADAASQPENAPRYLYVGAVFVLLSILPLERVSWVASVPVRRPAAALGLVALVLVLLSANDDGIRDRAQVWTRNGDLARNAIVELQQSPTLPDSDRMPGFMGSRTIGQLREIIDRLGTPFVITGSPDAYLVGHSALRAPALPESVDSPTQCTAAPVTLEIGSSVEVHAGEQPSDITVRRYESGEVQLRRVPAGRAVSITTAESIDPTPWIVSSTNGCLVDIDP